MIATRNVAPSATRTPQLAPLLTDTMNDSTPYKPTAAPRIVATQKRMPTNKLPRRHAAARCCPRSADSSLCTSKYDSLGSTAADNRRGLRPRSSAPSQVVTRYQLRTASAGRALSVRPIHVEAGLALLICWCWTFPATPTTVQPLWRSISPRGPVPAAIRLAERIQARPQTGTARRSLTMVTGVPFCGRSQSG